MVVPIQTGSAFVAGSLSHAFERLKHLAKAWHEVDLSDPIREAAVRFLRVHPLRAADALQLAAAFIAAERRRSHALALGRGAGASVLTGNHSRLAPGETLPCGMIRHVDSFRRLD